MTTTTESATLAGYTWQAATTPLGDTVSGFKEIGWSAYDRDGLLLLAYTAVGWSLAEALDRLRDYRERSSRDDRIS
jgi:hypothetical protein